MSCTRYYIGVDPSGAFNEGKGTTGIAVYDKKEDKIVYIDSVCADHYAKFASFFYETYTKLYGLAKHYEAPIMIEDFVVYATHATTFTNSKMETCQLLGYLKTMCFTDNIRYMLEPASAVKTRWSNSVLVHKHYVDCIGASCFHPLIEGRALMTHELDAIRHAVNGGKYKFKEE